VGCGFFDARIKIIRYFNRDGLLRVGSFSPQECFKSDICFYLDEVCFYYKTNRLDDMEELLWGT